MGLRTQEEVVGAVDVGSGILGNAAVHAEDQSGRASALEQENEEALHSCWDIAKRENTDNAKQSTTTVHTEQLARALAIFFRSPAAPPANVTLVSFLARFLVCRVALPEGSFSCVMDPTILSGKGQVKFSFLL